MELRVVISLVVVLIGYTFADSGKHRFIDYDFVSWCWTSTGYGNYRDCNNKLFDNDRSTYIDLSSMTTETTPSWVTVTFFRFADISNIEVTYTGEEDLVFNFVFSDGTSVEADESGIKHTIRGREYLLARADFSRRITRSLTIKIQGRSRYYRALLHEIKISGNVHGNLERVSDWEHGAKCRQNGRDCDLLINGFVDREYKMGMGQSALLYFNTSYPVTRLTVLEAVPEFGDSIYDRMAVTLGNPTGVGFHTETFEFSLCKQAWNKFGPVWQQVTLPRPTTAMYVNVTILGREEKLVNGLYELEIFTSKDGSRYRAQDQPCVHVRQVELDGCTVSCNCSSSSQPGLLTADNVWREEDSGWEEDIQPVVRESTGLFQGMSEKSKYLFALCGTAGLAFGCLIGWIITCTVLCRERRMYARFAAGGRKGSRKNLTKWEERDSANSSENSSPQGSLKKLRGEEWSAPIDEKIMEQGDQVKS